MCAYVMGFSQRATVDSKARDLFKWKVNHCLHRNVLRTKRFISSASDNREVMEVAKDNIRAFEKIPGPKSNRFLGTIPKYFPIFGEYRMDTLHKNAMLNYQLYGRLVRERILPSVNLVHVFHPDDMEVVFRSEGRYPERRSHLALYHYRKSKPDIYNTGGLLSTNGAEWWRLRSDFQKNMTSPQSVKSHITKIDAIAQEFVSWIQHGVVEGDDDLLPYLNRLLLETIGAVAFDMRLNSFSAEERDPASRSSQIVMAAFQSNSGILKLDHGFLWKYFNTPLYKKMARSQEYLEKFSKEVLTSRLKLFQASQEQTPHTESTSLLDMFLLLPGVDLKDIVGMMVDILMAAVDTTSYSTSFLLYHIARNASCQERLFKECLELMPRGDSPVTNDTLSKAVYAKSCIKESLRLNPVAIGVGRVLEKDVALSGYHVPTGTVVVTQNMIASRLHQYCSDPASFKPERWLRQSDNYENIHPFLSLPFGFGPRSCIARRLAEQTMCVNLLKIVRNFQLDWTGGDMDVKTLLINKPNCSVQIKMTPITVESNV